ncbi:MAG: 16S rRNA (uracil(1498)-N(3))-methyltransferase [Chitinophagaceae bacterium]|nr:16S rRNA (uracil(1498)-N(3))-methyltransferase [Chitinophagaceae bacterium]
MNLPVFFYELPVLLDGLAPLDEDTSRHVIQVLRKKMGDQLLITDGRGHLWRTHIQDDYKKKATVKVDELILSTPPPRKITIAISLVKNNSRFEWFLEKATEIGVTHIIPLLCERTEKQHFRYERMKAILISAMLQSQQVWLPELSEPQPYSQLMAADLYEKKFIAHCDKAPKILPISGGSGNSSSILLIGPEGDFTSLEVKQALAEGYQAVTLGDTRLRTETAGIVGATLLKFSGFA